MSLRKDLADARRPDAVSLSSFNEKLWRKDSASFLSSAIILLKSWTAFISSVTVNIELMSSCLKTRLYLPYLAIHLQIPCGCSV